MSFDRKRAIQVLGCEDEGLVQFLLHWVKRIALTLSIDFTKPA